MARHNMARKKGIRGEPGSVDYLYGEVKESTHGRQPGTLASLAMEREQRTREILAEAGVSPESAAVSLKAAKEALLKHMPDGVSGALSAAALFQAATVPSRTTGQHALRELLADGAIQRITRGGTGTPFLYFKRNVASEERVARVRGELPEKKRGRE